jgi:hypothetical protein
MLRPYFEMILTKVFFPLFCFTDEDAETWATDPAEFLRKETGAFVQYCVTYLVISVCTDFLEDFWDPRLTSLNVVFDLIKLRSVQYLHILAAHALGVLQTCVFCSFRTKHAMFTHLLPLKLPSTRRTNEKSTRKRWRFIRARESVWAINGGGAIPKHAGALDGNTCTSRVYQPAPFFARQSMLGVWPVF